MDLNEQKNRAIAEFYVLLDTLRAKQYVNPALLEIAASNAQAGPIIQEQLPDWAGLLASLKREFAAKSGMVDWIEKLRRFEFVPLLLWLAATAAAIASGQPLIGSLQSITAFIAFGYLLVIRLGVYFLMTRPTSKIITQLQENGTNFDERLRCTIISLIEIINRDLLAREKSPEPYKNFLNYRDYPGLYIRGKPSIAGPSRVLTMPFPLSLILSETKGRVRIMLGRLDEKVVQVLARAPEDTEINIITLRKIARQSTFAMVYEPVYKTHKKVRLILVEQDPTLSGVQVLTGESAWKLDSSAGYAELRYVRIKNEAEQETISKSFNRLWEAGIQTKVVSKRKSRVK